MIIAVNIMKLELWNIYCPASARLALFRILMLSTFSFCGVTLGLLLLVFIPLLIDPAKSKSYFLKCNDPQSGLFKNLLSKRCIEYIPIYWASIFIYYSEKVYIYLLLVSILVLLYETHMLVVFIIIYKII